MKGFKKLNSKTATLIGVAIIAMLVVGIGTVYAMGLYSSPLDGAKDTAVVESSDMQTETTAKATKETKKSKTKKEETTKKETTNSKSSTKTAAKTTGRNSSGKTANSTSKAKDSSLFCKLTISCKTVVGNSDLKSSKKSIVPSNGIIYATKKVKFEKGDTVYDVLRRETKKRGISVDSQRSYGQYIRGIANLYEFDCGDMSGWMYKVNGSFPNYTCSSYKVKSGDHIQFVYTCNMGEDIGGNNF